MALSVRFHIVRVMNLRLCCSFNIIPMSKLLLICALFTLCGCRNDATNAGAAPAGFVSIKAGTHSFGSSAAERATALSHTRPADEASVKARLDFELEPFTAEVGAFAIGETPVTNRQYAEFVAATGHRAPACAKEEWIASAKACGLGLDGKDDFAGFVQPLLWREGKPPLGREDDPVTLVTLDDATAYCAWLSKKLGKNVRLPDELESEIAGGATAYPWGDGWRSDACYADPANRAPRAMSKDTADVTADGVRDYAGQVYEWTRSPDGARRGFAIVRGGGCWLDEPADCRKAARRSVPETTRHILLGFRVVLEP